MDPPMVMLSGMGALRYAPLADIDTTAQFLDT